MTASPTTTSGVTEAAWSVLWIVFVTVTGAAWTDAVLVMSAAGVTGV